MEQLPSTQSAQRKNTEKAKKYSFNVTTDMAPLGFCSLARREKRRIRSIWVICEGSSIAATPLEGKRRGVLSYILTLVCGSSADIFI